MYGIFHRAIEELAKQREGAKCWEVIKQRAGISAPTYLLFANYPDDVFFQLAEAAAETLNTPLDEFMFELGRFWLRFTRDVGLDFVTDSHADIDAFLANLEVLHTRLAATMPGMRPFKIRVIRLGIGRWQLRYRSSRGGLTPFMLGALQAVGDEFHTPVQAERLSPATASDGCDDFLVETVAALV